MHDKLLSVDIGVWRSYYPHTNPLQLAIQRQNLEYTSLEIASGEVTFIYTKYTESLNNRLMSLCENIKLKETNTVIEDEVYHTCTIEGAKTTRLRTSEIHDGKAIDMGNMYSELMIRNSFEATKVMSYFDSKLSVSSLITIWNTLMKDVCCNEEIKGNAGIGLPFRTGDVQVGNHIGADYTKVTDLMQGWLDFYNSKKYDDYPFIKAIVLHYAFESIHPFCDGNGRMGRLLINNFLVGRGINSAKAVSFSMQINGRLNEYYNTLTSSENLYNDCTPLIEYMLDVMNTAYDTALKVQNGQEI